MIDRILVPLDGSSLAECVLPHAVAVAEAMDAEVTLLRAVVRESSPGSPAVDPLDWHMRKSEADSYLTEVASRLREAGVEVKTVLVEGTAPGRIIRYARGEDVGLIIISSHGKSGLSRWNINSVVQKVILQAYAPTMVVRAYRPRTDGLTGLRYQKLLLPLDGSQRAECTLPWARNLAGFHQCKLLLAHVVNRPEVPRRAPLTEEEQELVERLTELNRKTGEAYLEDLKSRLGTPCEAHLLVSDNPAASLHEMVEREDVDLVVMAAHGYSGGARWPYGSIALNFIAYGSRPLLMIQDVPPEEAMVTEAEKAASERAGH
ncbi:MAG: universal stress protein [Chloroflexota bacterium]|nr:universal stress protein [Chloroflexota bacterium]